MTKEQANKLLQLQKDGNYIQIEHNMNYNNALLYFKNECVYCDIYLLQKYNDITGKYIFDEITLKLIDVETENVKVLSEPPEMAKDTIK